MGDILRSFTTEQAIAHLRATGKWSEDNLQALALVFDRCGTTVVGMEEGDA